MAVPATVGGESVPTYHCQGSVLPDGKVAQDVDPQARRPATDSVTSSDTGVVSVAAFRCCGAAPRMVSPGGILW